MSHQYTDKNEVKTWLGITGTGQDTNLDFAIDAAAAAIDNYCGRQFTTVSLWIMQKLMILLLQQV